MSKIHLAANKGTNGIAVYARCASRLTANGKVKRNSRTTYRNMDSKIVDYKTFKETPDNQRCSHCMDAGLIAKNSQLAKKGLPPVAHLFDDN